MTRSPFQPALLGAAAWAAAILLVRVDTVAALFLVAPFIVVPFAWEIVATPLRSGVHPLVWQAGRVFALPAAVLLAVSFRLPPSTTAAALALPWLAVTLFGAAFGARRLLTRGLGPSEELSIDVGLAYLAVGGVCTLLCRATATPLGFAGQVGFLIAVHLHYAGFALPVLAGLAGRRSPGPAVRLAIPLVALGVPLLALGLATGVAGVKLGAGVALTLGAWLVAGVEVTLAARSTDPVMNTRTPAGFRPLIALSGGSLATGVTLGALYSARGVFPVPHVVDLARMVHVHGSLTAIGFAVLGFFAWGLVPAHRRAARGGLPFVPRFGRALATLSERGAGEGDRAPPGVVDSLSEFRGPWLPAERVHPDVRALFERTGEREMHVVMPAPRAEVKRLEARLVAIQAPPEGPLGARGAVFHDPGTSKPAASVLVGSHSYEGIRYLDIAFPVAMGELGLTLRMEPLQVGIDELGLTLTTRGATTAAPSDAGAWLSTFLGTVRLPLSVSVSIRTPGMHRYPVPAALADLASKLEPGGGDALVELRGSFFGRRCLTLDALVRQKAG